MLALTIASSNLILKFDCCPDEGKGILTFTWLYFLSLRSNIFGMLRFALDFTVFFQGKNKRSFLPKSGYLSYSHTTGVFKRK